MTDQERPDEERNELLDDLVRAATAVADTDEPKQQPAVVEQPESVAQPDAAPAAEQSADAPVAQADVPAEAQAATPTAEQSADAPVAQADVPAEAQAATPD